MDAPQNPPSTLSTDALRSLLQWYAEMGIEDVVEAAPTDMRTWHAPPKIAVAESPSQNRPVATTAPQTQNPKPIQPSKDLPANDAIAEATALAAKAKDIDALREAIQQFDGCPLKPGARNTVIDDGIFGAPLLILGEAPGREEDRMGKPFVGRAGQLLDKMLAAIGHSRSEDDLAPTYITNAIYWRPPGNRNPTPDETAICLPFVHRIIALAKPKLILTLGNVPTQILMPGATGITRSRGKIVEIAIEDQSFSVLPSFHPAYLLRSPTQKKLSWEDLKAARAFL